MGREVVDPLRFSLVEGGPLYGIGQRLGLAPGSRGLFELGLILAALTWVPLLVLNLLEASAGATVSFAWSLGTHTRFLVTIPLFFLAEAVFGAQVRAILRQLLDSQLVTPGEQPRFDAVLRDAMRWRDSALVEIALVAVAILMVVSGGRADLPGDVSSWRTTTSGTGAPLTPAGWWYSMVSLPVFQFLLWRWCWRLLIWWVVLWRFARLDLQLIPTHPDLAGGLGGLGVAHTDLAPLTFGISAMLVASYAEEVLFGGVKLESLVLNLAGIVVGLTALVLLPLAFFTPRLTAVKQRGLLEYGVLAASYTRALDTKWLRGGAAPDEALLGTADLQSLADMGSSFEIIRSMRLVPFAMYQTAILVAAAVLPMLLLLLTVFPLDELVLRSLKSLVGL